MLIGPLAHRQWFTHHLASRLMSENVPVYFCMSVCRGHHRHTPETSGLISILGCPEGYLVGMVDWITGILFELGPGLPYCI